MLAWTVTYMMLNKVVFQCFSYKNLYKVSIKTQLNEGDKAMYEHIASHDLRLRGNVAILKAK